MESKNIVIDFFNEAKDKLNLKEENRDGFLELMNDPEGRLEVFNLSKDKLGLSSFEVFENVLRYKEKPEGGDENTLEETEAVDNNVILTNNKPEELKKEMGAESVAATAVPEKNLILESGLKESSTEQPSTLQKNQEVSKGDTEKDKRKKEVSQIKLDIDSGLLKIKSLKVYTGATEERYGYVNRGDKKGNIQLTKFEYENLVEGKDPYELKLKVDKKIAPKVTVEEVDLDEEELVPVLKEKFKNTDFTVEEAMPLTDGIKIKNKITNKSEVFPIDAFTKEGDLEYANKINNWIKKEQVWGDKISERNQQEKNLYENLPEEKKKIIDEQVQKELSLIKKDREKIREEKKKKYVENLSYLDRLGIAFKTGGTMVGMSVSSIPESIYNVFAIPQNFLAYLIDEPTLEASAKRFKEKYNITNTALENYKKERDRLREISKSYDINTYENQGIMESISNEEYLDAFAQIGNGLAESAPVSISIMAGSGMTTLPQLIGGSTIALMGPEVIEQEEKNPDQNPLFATVKGMGIAAAETFFSAINAKALTFVYKDMLLKQGKDIAETTLRKGLLEMYQTALKKYGFPISALGEGFEEVLTLQTQNIINGRPLNEGVPDAFILGLSGGSMYGAPINAINFANKVPGLISGNEVSNKLKNGGFPSAYDALSNDKEVNENVVDVINIENSIPAIDNKLEEEVSNNEITEEESDAAKKKARQIQGVLNSLKSLGLNDAQTLTATNLIIEKSNLEETIKKVGDSALTTKESDRIKEINEELSNIRTKTPEELAQERLEESLEKEVVDGVESVVSEDIVTKEDVDIYTGNTPKKYGSYAAGDGSGRVEITEEEYNALPDTLDDVTAATESTTTDEISEITKEDYDKFVDTGVVDEGIINYLAEKVRKNETLNDIEQAIFNDKTSDVEEALRTTTEQKNINNKAAEDVSKGKSVVKKGLKDLMNAMSSVFGLNSTQAKASALIQDAIVATMAKREGISKEEMYEKIIFDKAEKAPDGSLKQEPLIFKSTAKEGLSKLPNNPMTPEAWVKQITEKGGKGTSQELNWIGLQDYLNEWKKENNSKSVPKEVVEQYINDNQIEIVEVTKNASYRDLEKLDIEIFYLRRKYKQKSKEFIVSDKIAEADRKMRENHQDLLDKADNMRESKTKWSKYTLEGGENYREVLLTLPPKPMTLEEYIKDARRSGINFTEKEIAEERYNEYLEDIGDDFSSSENFYKKQHFDEANILAHLRINERTLPNGERVMFIEEVQSDWAQEGKDRGFEQVENTKKIEESKSKKQEVLNSSKSYGILNKKTEGNLNKDVFYAIQQNATNAIDNQYSDDESRKERFLNEYPKTISYWGGRGYDTPKMSKEEWGNFYDTYLIELLDNKKRITNYSSYYVLDNIYNELKTLDEEIYSYEAKYGLPQMPYKKTDQWVGMAMRRAMQMAAQEGFDRVAWVTGEQSADRYDLSKQIDEIVYRKLSNEKYAITVNKDNSVLTKKELSENELEGYVGKEVAKKIIEGEGKSTGKQKLDDIGVKSLSGLDLKVGGEGMKTFYNSILPKVSKKEAQRFDKKANVEIVDFETNEEIDLRAIDGGFALYKDGEFVEWNESKTENEALEYFKEYIPQYTDKGASKQPSIAITPKMRMNLNGAVPLFQGARGAMTAADNQFVLYALTDPNVSTPVHEMAHVFEHYLTDQERNDILDWAGHTNWTTETSEKFARGFEKYLAEGKVSNPKLQEAFEQFKEWLTEIYNNIVGSDIDVELNEKMSNLYDSMLEETVEETVEETTPVEEEIDMGESTKRFVPRWLNNKIEPIRIAFQDKWYSLSKLQKIAARDGYINPKDDLTNIYLEKELEAGIVKQRIQNIIETIEGSKTFQGKSTFERMYKDGVNIDQLGLYMFAKHAQERNAYLKNKIFKELESLEKKKEKAELNRNFKEAKETQSKIDAMKSDINSGKLNTEGLSGMTNEQAKAIIEEVSKDKLTDKFDEYSKELRKKLADASLQLKVDYGLVSESEAKTLTKDWEFYVPLYVDEDSFEGGNYRSSTGKKGKGLYKLKGSDFYGVDKRVNPITGMIVQATAAAKKAQANQVFNAAFNLATKLNEENVTNIFGKPRKATGDDKSIKSQGKVYVGYVNGVETAIEIKDEKIQKALEDKVYTPNMFVKGVMMANNYLRMVNTLINPEFQLTNFVRDVQTAFINISAEDASKMNTKMLKNVPNAMKGIFTNELGISNKWSDIYQDLKESGGDVSWVQLLDMEAIKNRVNKAAESYKKSKTERNLKLLLKAGGELFQATTKSTEMATRLSAYKVALDAGYTKKQASSLAKNLTVNFEKKGTAGIFINTAYLFANAGIQGSTLVIRAMTKSGAGGNRARTIAGAIIGLSIMNSYINKQMGLSDEDKEEGKTPEYAYLAPFIKNSNMVFMTPEVDKDGNYKASAVTIPLPYGYNVLWSIGQNAADVMDGTVDYGEGLINTTESFLGAFNPRGTSPALQQILPTIGQSVTQQLTNQDWMGNPLYPERENQLKSQSYYKSATEASKITANYINSLTGGSSVKAGAIDLSPGVLDNYGSFAIGGLGRFIKQTYNIANDTTGGEEINLSSTPFVRKVYKPAYENRYLSYIYKYLEDPISKNEKQKKSFEDALSAYEKKEKEKIIEKYPTKDRGGVKNRLAAEEDLEIKIIGFERKKYLAEKSLYWEKSFRANTIERKIQELVNTNITDDNGDTFNKESWNKLPTYKKDEIIRTYSQQNAKKSWKKSTSGVKEDKYQKNQAKEIGVK